MNKNENLIEKGKIILKNEEQKVYFFDSLIVHKIFESGEEKISKSLSKIDRD